MGSKIKNMCISLLRKISKRKKSLESWVDPLSTLRKKWQVVPGAGDKRVHIKDLLKLSDEEFLRTWLEIRKKDSTGENFCKRGWYHELYKEFMKGKKVLDVGCGLGIDGVTFAQYGAEVTFLDIVEDNLKAVKRICSLLNLKNVSFFYMEDFSSLKKLGIYDVIWAQGSLHTAPFNVIKKEVKELVKHLKIGGRWIQLAYPKSRWIREGKLPFYEWGEKTDGEGTPWIEWYDLDKLLKLLEPAKFDVILYFEFHNNDFNWFDLIKRDEG